MRTIAFSFFLGFGLTFGLISAVQLSASPAAASVGPSTRLNLEQ